MEVGNKIRVFQITGVYLGSERREDMVGIKCLDKHNGVKGNGMEGAIDVEEMFVPLDIIELVMETEVERFLAYRKETERRRTKT